MSAHSLLLFGGSSVKKLSAVCIKYIYCHSFWLNNTLQQRHLKASPVNPLEVLVGRSALDHLKIILFKGEHEHKSNVRETIIFFSFLKVSCRSSDICTIRSHISVAIHLLLPRKGAPDVKFHKYSTNI